MSFTQKQRDFHLRKMRTRMSRLDVSKDGYVSRLDYELMGKRLADLSGMNKAQAEAMCREFLRVADIFGLKPGVKKSVNEAAQQASEAVLSMPVEEHRSLVHATHGVVFDAIDTNKNGRLSFQEFKNYLNVIAPELSEADIAYSFGIIDADKSGWIGRAEYLAAAQDFLGGVEETELSMAYMGPLLD